MSGARITATFDDRQFADGLRQLAALGRQPRPLLRAIGVGLVAGTMERFDRHVDPQGRGWTALNPRYQAIKRGPGILQERATQGGLMGSITFRDADRSVIVGTNKTYGAIHQFGGRVTARNARALRFRMAGGWVMVRSVRIPARPYLGLSDEDRQMVVDTIPRVVAFLRRA